MQLFIHGNFGTSFWWPDVFPDINQLGLGKKCWNLVTSSAEVEFCLVLSMQIIWWEIFSWSFPSKFQVQSLLHSVVLSTRLPMLKLQRSWNIDNNFECLFQSFVWCKTEIVSQMLLWGGRAVGGGNVAVARTCTMMFFEPQIAVSGINLHFLASFLDCVLYTCHCEH